MPHLTYAHYLAVLEGELPVALLHQQALQHLLEECPECRRKWEGEGLHGPGERRMEYEGSAAEVQAFLGLTADPRAVSLAQIEACKELIRKIRQATRKARDDLGWLLSLPMEDWPRRVTNARTRMRSRAFAELLIEEARERVKSAPKEAAVLAGLVKPALDRRPGRLELSWARALVARGQAHRANALRVAGDLRAADAAFAGLRAELDEQALEDPVLLAEIASLEASLRMDQRRMDEAEALLQEASRTFRSANDEDGHARVLIKQVNLAHSVGEPRRVLRHLDEFETLNAKAALKYRASTVAARVAALCDLGRPDNAREHLSLNRSALEAEDNPHSLAALHWLEGRIQLGMGNFLAAEKHFQDAALLFRKLERNYDAVMVSLDLAQALLPQGRTGELARLAAGLAGEFRSREVAPETRESLRLFEQAARAESLTLALLLDLRRSLQRLSPATCPPGTTG